MDLKYHSHIRSKIKQIKEDVKNANLKQAIRDLESLYDIVEDEDIKNQLILSVFNFNDYKKRDLINTASDNEKNVILSKILRICDNVINWIDIYQESKRKGKIQEVNIVKSKINFYNRKILNLLLGLLSIIVVGCLIYYLNNKLSTQVLNIAGNSNNIKKVKTSLIKEKARINQLDSLIQTPASKLKVGNIQGIIGLFNKKHHNGITSLGVKLDLKKKVCAINLAHRDWPKELNKNTISFPTFIEVISLNGNYKSKALIVDTFNHNCEIDKDGVILGPLINTSRKVLNELKAYPNQKQLQAYIRVLSDEEWEKDKELIELHADYGSNKE